MEVETVWAWIGFLEFAGLSLLLMMSLSLLSLLLLLPLS